MPLANYEVWLTDDAGVRLASLDKFLTLQAAREANRIANFTLRAPLSFDTNFVRRDNMIQVWRAPLGGRLKLWRAYFIRRWRFNTLAGSDQVVTLYGPDSNDLMRRRIVAAYASSAQAAKTDFADDMMKEVVTEALADGVSPAPSAGTRVWSGLSVQADSSAGPTITKSFPFDYLLLPGGGGVLSILANAAKEGGTEVFFDVAPATVASNSIDFQFRTTTGQPGQDVSDYVVFSQETGNLEKPDLEEDYTREENYIYAAGQGEEANRNVQQVYDAGRYNGSRWNRCEGFADARNQSADNGVIASGNNRLYEGRPRIRFTGIPVDTEGTRFGIDWDFGDRVQAKYLNYQFDCIIRAMTLSVDGDGNETIDARLDYEAAL